MKKDKIDRLLAEGKITSEQATALEKKVETSAITVVEPIRIRTNPPLFDHTRADEHYEQRMDLEEGVRHALGLPVYGLIAGIDSIIDAIGFGITELCEDVTFTASRIIYRSKDGWERGKIK